MAGSSRKSSLLDLRHSIVRTSGKPEVRCHPRLACGTIDADARNKSGHDGGGFGSTILENALRPVRLRSAGLLDQYVIADARRDLIQRHQIVGPSIYCLLWNANSEQSAVHVDDAFERVLSIGHGVRQRHPFVDDPV